MFILRQSHLPTGHDGRFIRYFSTQSVPLSTNFKIKTTVRRGEIPTIAQTWRVIIAPPAYNKTTPRKQIFFMRRSHWLKIYLSGVGKYDESYLAKQRQVPFLEVFGMGIYSADGLFIRPPERSETFDWTIKRTALYKVSLILKPETLFALQLRLTTSKLSHYHSC